MQLKRIENWQIAAGAAVDHGIMPVKADGTFDAEAFQAFWREVEEMVIAQCESKAANQIIAAEKQARRWRMVLALLLIADLPYQLAILAWTIA